MYITIFNDRQSRAYTVKLLLCQVGPVLRWRIRQHRHLHGDMLTDVAVHCLCACCALIQENRELYGYEGSHVGEQLPLHVDITRQ